MKKHIFKTIGIVLGISSIVGVSVLVTAANAALSPGLMIIQQGNSLYNGKYTNVGFKEALVGTKAINNGNYVLYFGSQAIESNLKFLYDVPKESNWSDFLNILSSNKEVNLGGDFWNAINYIKNASEQPWVSAKNKPEFVSYIHTVDEHSVLRKENFAKTLQSHLNEVVAIAPNFSNLSKKDQTKYEKMLNFIRQNTGGVAGHSQRKLPTSVVDFNSEDNKGVTWTIVANNLSTWSYSPFAKYSDLSNKQQYFNNDQKSIEFRNLWTFVQSRFSTAKDISISEGFILGFEKGVLAKKYSLSFDSETPPSSGGDSQPSTPPSKIKTKMNSLEMIENSSQIAKNSVSKPSSSFYNWLEEVYGKKK